MTEPREQVIYYIINCVNINKFSNACERDTEHNDFGTIENVHFLCNTHITGGKIISRFIAPGGGGVGGEAYPCLGIGPLPKMGTITVLWMENRSLLCAV